MQRIFALTKKKIFQNIYQQFRCSVGIISLKLVIRVFIFKCFFYLDKYFATIGILLPIPNAFGDTLNIGGV